VRETKGG